MKAAIVEALVDMLDYSPLPTKDDAIQAYENAEYLVHCVGDSAVTIEQLLEALQDVIDYALEPLSHHQHMVREQAQRLLREARAAV